MQYWPQIPQLQRRTALRRRPNVPQALSSNPDPPNVEILPIACETVVAARSQTLADQESTVSNQAGICVRPEGEVAPVDEKASEIFAGSEGNFGAVPALGSDLMGETLSVPIAEFRDESREISAEVAHLEPVAEKAQAVEMSASSEDIPIVPMPAGDFIGQDGTALGLQPSGDTSEINLSDTAAQPLGSERPFENDLHAVPQVLTEPSERIKSPRQYRPPPRTPPKHETPLAPKSAVPQSDRPLTIEVRLVFETGGFCRVSLLPRRRAPLPEVLLVPGSDIGIELIALQEEWYQDLILPDTATLLRRGVNWETALPDHLPIRWALSGRETDRAHDKILSGIQTWGFCPEKILNVMSLAQALDFVAAGEGIAVLRASSERFESKKVILRSVPGLPSLDIGIVYRRNIRTPLVRNLLRVAREVFTEERTRIMRSR